MQAAKPNGATYNAGGWNATLLGGQAGQPGSCQTDPTPWHPPPLAWALPLSLPPASGAFPANRYTSYMTSSTSIDVSLLHKEMVILGSQYAGEMKKGVFSVMQYLLPKVGGCWEWTTLPAPSWLRWPSLSMILLCLPGADGRAVAALRLQRGQGWRCLPLLRPLWWVSFFCCKAGIWSASPGCRHEVMLAGCLAFAVPCVACVHPGSPAPPRLWCRHRQDHTVCRPPPPPHRRRRARLVRPRRVQHRGRLLRQGHRPQARE